MLTARMFSSAKNRFIFNASRSISLGLDSFFAFHDSTSPRGLSIIFFVFCEFVLPRRRALCFFVKLTPDLHQFVSISWIVWYSARFTGTCIP